MLIERNELQFDFGDARFDTRQERDRAFLGWVFDQFLYGEVTGIQCGHWLYRAPTLAAASFLARQAAEELSHVKRIRKIQELLDVKPADAHRAVKFLSTGMMGGTWGEHVCLEMALGEGLVLTIFYALATTIDDEGIRKIVESACLDEERHVTFGEAETAAWLARFPGDRAVFLGQALLQWMAMRRLKNFALKKLPPGHPVLGKFSAFYDHTLEKFDLRARKLGLADRPLREIPLVARAVLLLSLPFRTFLMRRRRPKRLLTETYLSDEWIRSPDKA
ncbi:MAG: ferritin-like domain-containing protein [Bdellovibrionales bacterium]|nr:ferritin-like domain-containing protein [Bdellovibrionales bacterium]